MRLINAKMHMHFVVPPPLTLNAYAAFSRHPKMHMHYWTFSGKYILLICISPKCICIYYFGGEISKNAYAARGNKGWDFFIFMILRKQLFFQNPEFAYNAALAALRASRMAPPRTQLVPHHKKTGPNGPLHRSGGPFAWRFNGRFAHALSGNASWARKKLFLRRWCLASSTAARECIPGWPGMTLAG